MTDERCIGDPDFNFMGRAETMRNTIREFLIYDAVAPFEPFRYFFFIGFLVSLFALVFQTQLASYTGYVPLSIGGGGIGAARFLIDAYCPLALIYIILVLFGLSKERIIEVNLAVKRNKFAKNPVLLALICLLLAPYIFFIDHSVHLIEIFSLNKFINLLFAIPMFCYTTVQSFIIVVCSVISYQYNE